MMTMPSMVERRDGWEPGSSSSVALSGSQPRIVVVGLGNTLRQDDGVGCRAVARLLARGDLPESVTLLDGGVLGLELLAYLEGASHWLLIDAVRTGRSPGALVRLTLDEIPEALPMKLSLHEAGVLDLLAIARLRDALPAHLVLWGVEPATVAWSTELTPVVAASLEPLVDAVAQEVWAWVGPLPIGHQLSLIHI